MAEHADTAEMSDESLTAAEDTSHDVQIRSRRRPSKNALAATVGALAIVALGSVAGWMGVQWQHQNREQVADAEILDAARQAAVNLTSIDFADIDADIQRILDASAGSFRDQFAERSQPFTAVVRQAQSKTEGTVSAAGIESQDGRSAKVLVAVTVKTMNAGQPEQEPRSWRMRISIDREQAGPKMTDVQFVP